MITILTKNFQVTIGGANGSLSVVVKPTGPLVIDVPAKTIKKAKK